MEVYKFGGASVQDAPAISNVVNILRENAGTPKVVVVSAMGKTTNALEQIVEKKTNGENWEPLFDQLIGQHEKVWAELSAEPFPQQALEHIHRVRHFLSDGQPAQYTFVYDQVVSLGEFLSTAILSACARKCGIDNTLTDARQFIFTDNAWTEGKILWDKTEKAIHSAMATFQQQKVTIVQGFIGKAPDGHITTLGREGSDYTASVFAYALQADKMTIWKDVKGVMNADPKEFPEAVWIPELTYHEAIEMTYYGAKVIHPKTIQPIQNRNIPLEVRSFIDFREKGTMVMSNANTLFMPPVIVFKPKQVLLSFSTKDFSFIAEEHLREIFAEFAGLRLHMNMMQNAAISFSVCVDDKKEKINRITDSLEKRFVISRFENLQLLTVRHYHEPLIRKLTDGKEVMLEQISRNNWQILMRS